MQMPSALRRLGANVGAYFAVGLLAFGASGAYAQQNNSNNASGGGSEVALTNSANTVLMPSDAQYEKIASIRDVPAVHSFETDAIKDGRWFFKSNDEMLKLMKEQDIMVFKPIVELMSVVAFHNFDNGTYASPEKIRETQAVKDLIAKATPVDAAVMRAALDNNDMLTSMIIFPKFTIDASNVKWSEELTKQRKAALKDKNIRFQVCLDAFPGMRELLEPVYERARQIIIRPEGQLQAKGGNGFPAPAPASRLP